MLSHPSQTQPNDLAMTMFSSLILNEENTHAEMIDFEKRKKEKRVRCQIPHHPKTEKKKTKKAHQQPRRNSHTSIHDASRKTRSSFF